MALGLGGGQDTRVKSGTGSPDGSLVAPKGTMRLPTDAQGSAYLKRETDNQHNWYSMMLGSRGSFPYFYVSATGNDSNNGRSPGESFLTIGAAISALAGNGGEIIVGSGTYIETLSGLPAGIRIRGVGRAPTGASTVIQAPSAGANCITLTTGNVFFDNIVTQGFPGTWTGVGWSLDGCSNSHFRDCAHYNAGSDTVNATYGGTAVQIQNSEGNHWEDFNFTRPRVAFYLVDEASTNYFESITGSGAYSTTLKIAGVSGGNTFHAFKTTGGGGTTDCLDIGGGGDNRFIAVDCDESPSVRTWTISSNNNRMFGCVTSPNTGLTISGDKNILIGHKVNGEALRITGKGNVVELVEVGFTGSVIDTGANNVFLYPPQNVTAPITHNRTSRRPIVHSPYYPTKRTVGVAGGAAAPPATPAQYITIQDPSTGQNLLVPAYLPAANPVLDSFIRADNASVIGTADSGQAWTSNSGTWGIASNQLYHSAANGGALATLDSTIADGIVEADLIVTAAGGEIGLVFRLSDTSNYFFTSQSGSGTLQKVVTGSATTLGNIPNLVAGDHVRIICSGSSIAVDVNGQIRLQVTDTFNQTATKHGFYSNFDTAARWKNFRVTA